ncbi:hypothetical protein [Bradyrhizobium sp. P5_C11_2]
MVDRTARLLEAVSRPLDEADLRFVEQLRADVPALAVSAALAMHFADMLTQRPGQSFAAATRDRRHQLASAVFSKPHPWSATVCRDELDAGRLKRLA